MKRNTLRSSLNSPRPLAAATRIQASLDGRGRGTRPTAADPYRGASDQSSEDVRSLVLKLTSQVELLTAIVAEQRGDSQPLEDETE